MKQSSLNLTTLSLLVACAAGCSRAEETTSLDELTLLAKHTDPNMRYSAMEQIGQSGSAAEAAVPALIEGLRDKSPMVRLGAAYAVGKLGDKASSAAAPLAQSLKDPDR